MTAQLDGSDVNRIHTRLDSIVKEMGHMNTEIARIHGSPCTKLELVAQTQAAHEKEHETRKIEAQQVRGVALNGVMRVLVFVVVGLGGICWAVVASGALSKFLGN